MIKLLPNIADNTCWYIMDFLHHHVFGRETKKNKERGDEYRLNRISYIVTLLSVIEWAGRELDWEVAGNTLHIMHKDFLYNEYALFREGYS